MVRTSFVVFAAFAVLVAAPAVWSVSVEVNKSGDDSVAGGPYLTLQAAIDYCQSADDGDDVVTITDSGVYEETFWIGAEEENIAPVHLTSNQTGDDRPVISPLEALGPFLETHRDDRLAGTAITSNESMLSNVILESNPDLGTGDGASALHLEANGVIIENVLIRPRAGTSGVTKYPNSGIFLSQEGFGGVPEPNGRMCDNVVIRNCHFIGVATDGQTEPTMDMPDGYLLSGENGQFATFARCDAFTNAGDMIIDVLFDNCRFEYSYDAGLFPSNRGDSGLGAINWTMRDCYFDSFGKFAVRSRGTNFTVERCIFRRTNQGNHGDGENSAVAQQTQGGNSPDSTVSNCLFVNCGGVYAKKPYYGGVRNHSGGFMHVNHCTFDLCNTGVSTGNGEETIVSNCIFNRIGYNQAPAVWYEGFPPETDEPFPTWESENFEAGWVAVFNNPDDMPFVVNNCIVNDLANEDTAGWEEVTELSGTRLYAGFPGESDTVIRDDPGFANTDVTADDPYVLAEGSPAVDIAVAAEPAPGDMDLDGDARVVGGAADVGCQELAGAGIREWSLF